MMKFPKVFLKRSLSRKIQGTENLENTHIKCCHVYFLRIEKKQHSNDNANVSVSLYPLPVLTSQNIPQSSELLDNVKFS